MAGLFVWKLLSMDSSFTKLVDGTCEWNSEYWNLRRKIVDGICGWNLRIQLAELHFEKLAHFCRILQNGICGIPFFETCGFLPSCGLFPRSPAVHTG